MQSSKLFRVLVLCVLCLLMAAPCALAYGGGGGGGGGGPEVSRRDKRSFETTRPTVSGAPVQKQDPHIGRWGIRHETWGKIYGTIEGSLMVVDYGSTVACFFLPGPGWVKAAHTAGKIVAFTRDKRKQDFVKGIFTKITSGTPRYSPPALPAPDVVTPMGHRIYK